MLLLVGVAFAYAEDNGEAGTPSSSFHYALTRALALAAGYAPADAELIAVVDQATDSRRFTGDDLLGEPIRVLLEGTARFGERGLFFHFPRREDLALPCAPRAAGCTPELGLLERWAAGDGALPWTPRLRVGDGPEADVAAGSLAALGVFLHAVGDSYSHASCMDAGTRLHAPFPRPCSVLWHYTEEYGSGHDAGHTADAGLAVWRSLRDRPGAPAPRVGEADAADLVARFVAEPRALVRVRLADAFSGG